MRLIKSTLALFAVLTASMAFGSATITVISPTQSAVLGANNTVSFSIVGAVTAVTVQATLTGTDVNTTGTVISTTPQQFTDIVDNKVNGSLTLNLARSLPEGVYTLQVIATETGNTYNTPPLIDVTVVLNPPKFVNFSPNDGQFIKGIVPITVSVETAHMKDWRVQVNGQDIPNNTGSTTSFAVNWDTSLIPTDGPQTITVTVRDLANNVATQTMTVTLDRLPPVATIQYPRADTPLVTHTTVQILVNISDASSSSVDVTGVDVVITTLAGDFIRRIPRVSMNSTGSTTVRWTGRLRPAISLPKSFILKVTVVDKAGNAAAVQQVTLTTN